MAGRGGAWRGVAGRGELGGPNNKRGITMLRLAATLPLPAACARLAGFVTALVKLGPGWPADWPADWAADWPGRGRAQDLQQTAGQFPLPRVAFLLSQLSSSLQQDSSARPGRPGRPGRARPPGE